MKFKYTGNGAYISGLPAVDLDDKDLTPEQKSLLDLGVSLGMYQKQGVPEAPKKEKGKDVEKAA